jgi:hypothetical protein
MEDLMSVSPVSGGAAPYQPGGQTADFRAAFQQLTSAINSGDLQAAQQAYATLSSLQQSSGQTNSQTPIAQLLASLGQELASGDISSAQQALQAFQKANGHHHHQHPQGASDTDGDSASSGQISGSSGILA